MNLRNLHLTIENLSNGGPALLVKVNPAYEYKDGQRTNKQIGLKVDVAFPNNKYDTQTVTVDTLVDSLSAALDKATYENPVYVEFEGFSAQCYVMNNKGGGSAKGGISAKAKAVRIVPAPSAGKEIDFG